MAAEFSGGGGANQNQQPKGSQQPRFGKQRQRMRTASMPAENRKVSRKLRLNDKQADERAMSQRVKEANVIINRIDCWSMEEEKL